jgi:DnaK suppressor protein
VAAQPKAAAAPPFPLRAALRAAPQPSLWQPLRRLPSRKHESHACTISAPTAAVPKKDPKLANNWKTKSAEELTDAEVWPCPMTST